MKISVTKDQVEALKVDAKMLVDISRMLEIDGRFNFLPKALDGIASDILELFKVETEQPAVVEPLEEVIDRARVQRNDPID